ncbi:MAG: DMT family transporter [Alphaproteobacteria bacterium]
MSRFSAPVSGIALMALATATFAGADSLSKLLVADYPVPQVVWLRQVAGLAIWLPVILWVGGRDVWRTARPGMHAVRAALHLASAVFFHLALTHVPLAEATALFYVEPLLLTALAVPLLGEKVGWRRWAAVGVGLGGMLLLVRPGSGDTSMWMVFPLCSAVVFALYEILTRRAGFSDRPMTSFVWLLGGMIVLLAPAVPVVWQPMDQRALLLLALLGLISGGAQFLMIFALARAPASVLAPLRYCHLVWATLLGMAIFGTLPDGWSLAGMAVIAGAGLYVWHRERRQAAA